MASESEQIQIERKDVDNSSNTNQRIVFSSLFLQLFLLLNIAAVTDIQIFVPDSTLTLPIFNIGIPLTSFATLVPFLLLAFHFYELYNLSRHSKKLFAWTQSKANIQNSENFSLVVHPFIFNNIRYDGKRTHEVFIQLFVFSVVFLLPIILLIYHLFVFAKFHDISLTVFNLVAVLLDAFVIFVYHHRIVFPDKYLNKNPSDLERLRRKFTINPIVDFIKLIGWSLINRLKRSKKTEPRAVAVPAPEKTPKKKESPGSQNFIRRIVFHFVEYATYISVFVAILLSYKTIWISLGMEAGKGDSVALELSEQDLTRNYPDKGSLAYRFSGAQDSDSLYWQNLITSYSMKNRNLSHGKFFRSTLAGFDFRGGMARHATFDLAVLADAYLHNCNFDHSRMRGTLLNGTDMSNSSFVGVDFSSMKFRKTWQTRMMGVEADSCDFSKANFKLVQSDKHSTFAHSLFWKTDMVLVDMPGVDLSEASFIDARLCLGGFRFATFRNTRFWNCSMFSADLTGGNFDGSSLLGSCLISADFSGAFLDRADFSYTDLRGADLSDALIDNCNFYMADMRGAKYDSTLIPTLVEHGAILGPAFTDTLHCGCKGL